MTDDVYYKLREFLDSIPGGYPETESGVEIGILEKLFTPQEAEMEMNLTQRPERVSDIAERAGMDETEAAELLESMAKQGSIYRLRIDEEPYYLAVPFIVGIYEFHLNALDRELAEMVEEYMPYLALRQGSIDTKQLRVVPVGSALDTTPSVAPYDVIRDQVTKHEDIAVAHCICRKEQGLLDNPCDRPSEVCLTFGLAAQYNIENGIGRRIDTREALEILDRAEESALVLAPTNARDIINICCCCKCCCGFLRFVGLTERPVDHVMSSFRAIIDPDLCTACAECLERCQIDAIWEKDEAMEVNPARCLGCGLCVQTCPENAIKLVQKTYVESPPANIVEMQLKMAEEYG